MYVIRQTITANKATRCPDKSDRWRLDLILHIFIDGSQKTFHSGQIRI